ncbi:MAG TPA: hypothetical protein VMU78_05930 [Methylocella sp.]|nr:hypothetical protein [Methylocella sp.]
MRRNSLEIAQFLTALGIDSISVNPSSLLRTIAVRRSVSLLTAMGNSRLEAAPAIGWLLLVTNSREEWLEQSIDD